MTTANGNMATANGGSDDPHIDNIALALIKEHGSPGAIRVAETLASGTTGDGRIFWLDVAKAIRARPSVAAP